MKYFWNAEKHLFHSCYKTILIKSVDVYEERIFLVLVGYVTFNNEEHTNKNNTQSLVFFIQAIIPFLIFIHIHELPTAHTQSRSNHQCLHV